MSSPEEARSIFSLPECPVYYPTEDEFRNPIEYVRKITPEAEKFGICKIVPPSLKAFGRMKTGMELIQSLKNTGRQFMTKQQMIHQLQTRRGPNEVFMVKLTDFLRAKGISLPIPIMDGRPLDIYKFFYKVIELGGFENVVKNKRMSHIGFHHLRFSSSITTAGYTLIRFYKTYLLDYENYHFNGGRAKPSGTPAAKRAKTEGRAAAPALPVSLDEVSCEICGRLDDDEHMLLCDMCNRGYHMYCCRPPVVNVPAGEWFCEECKDANKLNQGTEDFGYNQGKSFTLEAFETTANNFRKKWFGKTDVSFQEAEREYWRIVEESEDYISVFYGSDVDARQFGEGLPNWSAKLDCLPTLNDPGWNMSNLPRYPGSPLRYLVDHIVGVESPMLYFGMLFSTFCWHVEDNYLFSINFLHAGDPKVWYGVPQRDGLAFEQVMRSFVPKLFQAQPDLLNHLITMLSPSHLARHGVAVCHTVQRQGEIMLTFPGGFHSGFNMGFNCAESVNFALPCWLPLGRLAVERYREEGRTRLAAFSQDQLVCSIIRSCDDSPELAAWIATELVAMGQQEIAGKSECLAAGVARFALMRPAERMCLKQCAVCSFDCYLSFVECTQCRRSKHTCLRHFEKTCSCDMSSRTVKSRFSHDQFMQLVAMNEQRLRGAGGARQPRGSGHSPSLAHALPCADGPKAGAVFATPCVAGGRSSMPLDAAGQCAWKPGLLGATLEV